jgi:hypothetical protein
MKTAEINKFRKNYTPYTKPCVYDGLKLAVLFDEKDWAKKFGARWDANEGCWWLPGHTLRTHPSGDEDVVYGELNKRKMIVGGYGNLDEESAKMWMLDATSKGEGATEVYRLQKGVNWALIQYWSQIEALRIEEHKHPHGTDKIYSLDDGRAKWDEFISKGYNREFEKVSI